MTTYERIEIKSSPGEDDYMWARNVETGEIVEFSLGRAEHDRKLFAYEPGRYTVVSGRTFFVSGRRHKCKT